MIEAYFSTEVISSILMISMFFIGLPHGAADLIIIYKSFGYKKAILLSFSYFFFFLFGMALWKYQSNLFLFILWPASLFHFMDVETQLRKIEKIAYEDIMFFSLFTLPIIKLTEFETYLSLLRGITFFQLFQELKLPIIFIQILLSFFIIFKNLRSRKNNLKGFLLGLAIYFILAFLVLRFNLLISFTTIFLFIHSLRHLKLNFSKKVICIKSYLFILLPTSLLSFLFIYLFQKELSSINENHLFFMIGLGSLAFPHLIVERLLSWKSNPTKEIPSINN